VVVSVGTRQLVVLVWPVRDGVFGQVAMEGQGLVVCFAGAVFWDVGFWGMSWLEVGCSV